jgi:hypothetical protein
MTSKMPTSNYVHNTEYPCCIIDDLMIGDIEPEMRGDFHCIARLYLEHY